MFSLAFSPDSMFLAVSSETDMIHMFRLTNPTTGFEQHLLFSFHMHMNVHRTSETMVQDHPFVTIRLSSSSRKKKTMGMRM